ncbi:ABC transporter permease [Leucobacter weissii]|uniref:ABC transporter permease n=1 Tax=Leucobacter weissii TaxID=1983706 RepID=A0A939MKR2_9MICO|nr:ABC transporter permease [Leucobacter weissii]MBO1902386.1 ABC transporter permease [Leucobacter weissii]
MSAVSASADPATGGDGSRGGRRRSGPARALLRDPSAIVCLSVLGLFAVAAVLGVTLWSDRAFATSIADSYLPPSPSHPMGTDAEGRDLLARVLYGSAISLGASLSITVIAGAVGSALGLIAGLARGATDTLILRALDSLLAFPTIVLAICVSIGLGAGIGSAIVGIALSCVPYYGRLIRSDVVRITAQPFVESALALGSTRRHVVLRHVLPHTVPTLLVQSASVLGAGAVMLAGLSFLGLGASLPTPEWGAMITAGIGVSLTGQWWVVLFPGLALVVFAASAHLLSERIRALSSVGGRA